MQSVCMDRSIFHYSPLTQDLLLILCNKYYLELLWHLPLFHVAEISRLHLLCHSTNYLALVKGRVITAKQISYSAPKRHIFILFREKKGKHYVASHHGSPVRRHWHGNPHLRNGFWHVWPVSLTLPVRVDPNTVSCLPLPACTAAMCGPSAEELGVFCAFSTTAPIATTQSTKIGSRSVTLRNCKTSNLP